LSQKPIGASIGKSVAGGSQIIMNLGEQEKESADLSIIGPSKPFRSLAIFRLQALANDLAVYFDSVKVLPVADVLQQVRHLGTALRIGFLSLQLKQTCQSWFRLRDALKRVLNPWFYLLPAWRNWQTR